MPRVLMLAGLCLLLTSVPVRAEEDDETDDQRAPLPPALRETLDEAVGTLEAEKYEEFLKRFLAPDVQERLHKRLKWSDVVRNFGLTRSGPLLRALTHVKKEIQTFESVDKMPYQALVNEDHTIVTFPLPSKFPGPNKQIRFRLYQKTWYLMNN